MKKSAFNLAYAIIIMLMMSMVLAATTPLLTRRDINCNWEEGAEIGGVFYYPNANRNVAILTEGPDSEYIMTLHLEQTEESDRNHLKDETFIKFANGHDEAWPHKEVGSVIFNDTNVGVGYFEHNNLKSDSVNNCIIGSKALFSWDDRTLNNNVAIGFQSLGELLLSGSGQPEDSGATAIGMNSLYKAYVNNMSSLLAIGTNALAHIGSDVANIVCIGNNKINNLDSSQSAEITASNNLLIGHHENLKINSENNLFITNFKFDNLKEVVNKNNIIVGLKKCIKSINQGVSTLANNVVVGANSLIVFDSNQNNVVLGYNNLSIEDARVTNSVIIGTNCQHKHETSSLAPNDSSGFFGSAGTPSDFVLISSSMFPTCGALASVLIGASCSNSVHNVGSVLIGHMVKKKKNSIVDGIEKFNADDYEDMSTNRTYLARSVVIGNYAFPNAAKDGDESLYNVIIGHNAGEKLLPGSRNNIIIGCNAGPATAKKEEYKLYIDNKQTDDPFIYGDFVNEELSIRGQIQTLGSIKTSNLYLFKIALNGLAYKKFISSNKNLNYETKNILANNINIISDRRLKENINDVDVDINDFNKLKVRYFVWKNDSDKRKNIGVIAQEVERIFPFFVHKNKTNGYLTVDNNSLFFAAINVLQKLDLKLTTLKNERQQLQARLEKLENEIYNRE